MSARKKLLLSVGVLFAVSILLISLVGYYHFKTASLSGSTSFLSNQSFLIAKSLEQSMNRYFDALEFTQNELPVDRNGVLDEAALVKTLTKLKEQFSTLDAYIGLEDGSTYAVATGGLIDNFNAKELGREWYKRAFAGEKRILTTPYTSNNGNLVMAVAVPIVREEQVAGILSINLTIDSLTQYVKTLSEKNQIFVSRDDGFVIAAHNPDYIGKNLFEVRPTFKEFKGKAHSEHRYEHDGDDYFVVENIVDNYKWQVWSWEYWTVINEESNNNLIENLAMAAVFIVIVIGLVFYLVQKLMYLPIGGEPSHIQKIVEQVASGDLRSLESDRGNEVGIYGAILKMGQNLKDVISQINHVSDQLNASSLTMMQSAHSVNESSKEQMVQIEASATAMNEMTSTVEDVARSATEAAASATHANETSTAGMATVSEVNNDIFSLIDGTTQVQSVLEELNNETIMMASVLDVINGIAEQTNLLALNAAIEAARAGDTGRGFAVVADEVRTLATRTQQSTNEIQEMINKLKNSATTSVRLIESNANSASITGTKSEEANQALTSIQSAVSNIQDMNHQIAAAAEEQAIVVGDINKSIFGINDLAKSTFEASEQNIHSAGDLTELANKLNRAVETFKL